MFHKLVHSLARIQCYIDRPWYTPLVALLAAADLFVLFIPTDGLLVSAVLMKPKRWVSTFLLVATGSALGALLLAGLVEWDSALVTDRLFPHLFHTSEWASTEAFMGRYGLWALALIAASPLPQLPAVALAALARMPLWDVFAAVWVGRAAKYALFAWSASHAPRFVLRVWGVQREMRDLGEPDGGRDGMKVSEPT